MFLGLNLFRGQGRGRFGIVCMCVVGRILVCRSGTAEIKCWDTKAKH